MKKFDHVNASSIEEAASILNEYKEKATIIAGGTDLLGVLKDRIKPDYPEVLVNIKTIPGLKDISEESGVLKIGALATLNEVAENGIVNTKYSVLSQAALLVSSPLLRNAGTIGGNLCQEVRCWYYRMPKNYFFCFRKGGTLCNAIIGDSRYNAILGGQVCFAVCPSDIAIALTALDATIVTNKRNIAIGEMYEVLGPVLSEDEIVTEIQVPEPSPGTKQEFTKIRMRKAVEFAIASVAIAIVIENGTVSNARIVLGGISPTPYIAKGAEDVLRGNPISESIAEEAGAAAVEGAMPLPNNSYLIQMAKTLVKNAVLS